MTERVGDHGFLSDCTSAALVSREGTVDWWCLPRFDGPSVLGALLGPDAGAWSLGPAAPGTSARSYLDDTLVLRTVHETATGSVAVTDTLALEHGARGHAVGVGGPRILVRRVEGLKGRVEMRTELAPRPEYGLVVPHLRLLEPPARGVEAVGGPVRLLCTGPLPWELADGAAASTFTVAAGDDLTLRLAAETAFPEPEGTDADRTADAAC